MQCTHCGRNVHETIHRQKSYAVDYYLLHTGQTEWTFLVSPKEDVPAVHYLKLTEPRDVITCIDCYASPDIRQRLDDDFSGRRAFETRAPNKELNSPIW